MTDNNDTKIEYFYTKELIVHVRCFNGRFYNGNIIEVNKEKKFLILKDRRIGDVPILFEEIKVIEPFEEDRR